MAIEDAAKTRMVRAEITRRYVDSTMLDVHVTHGTVYLRGLLRPLKTHKELDMHHEVEVISHILRGKPGIREIIWEARIIQTA